MSLQTETMAENNMSNLSRVRVGMEEDEVRRLMHAPYSEEQFSQGEDCFDVWMYVTRVTALGQSRMVPQNLTPLIFRNGILVGWGFGYYRYVKDREIPVTSGQQEEDRTEDRGIEKALKGAKGGAKESPGDAKHYPQVILPLETKKNPQAPVVAPAKKNAPQKSKKSAKKDAYGPQPLHPAKQPKEPKQPSVQKPPPPLQAMSTKPKKTEENPPEDTPKKAKPYLEEEDEEMIEEADEQNFDFW